MKYAIIIPDGAADEPLKELGGKTPLEVAETLWTKFPCGIILDTVIPRDETFLEASLRGSPLLLMSKRPPPLSRVFDQLEIDVVREAKDAPDDFCRGESDGVLE